VPRPVTADELTTAVLALVAADQALADRVSGLERLFLDRFEDIHRDEQGVVRLDQFPNVVIGVPKRRGLLSRLVGGKYPRSGQLPTGSD
jgi:hypothetical protein